MSLFTEQEIQEYEEKATKWIGAFAAALIDVVVEIRKLGRRERIATAVLQGVVASLPGSGPENTAAIAIEFADALIVRLDREQPKEPT